MDWIKSSKRSPSATVKCFGIKVDACLEFLVRRKNHVLARLRTARALIIIYTSSQSNDLLIRNEIADGLSMFISNLASASLAMLILGFEMAKCQFENRSAKS